MRPFEHCGKQRQEPCVRCCDDRRYADHCSTNACARRPLLELQAELPGPEWEWEDAWSLARSSQTDADGWMYAFNFGWGLKWYWTRHRRVHACAMGSGRSADRLCCRHSSSSLTHCVRRRMWTRRVKYTPKSSGAAEPMWCSRVLPFGLHSCDCSGICDWRCRWAGRAVLCYR